MAEQQVFPTKGNLIASKKALKLATLASIFLTEREISLSVK